MTVARGVSIGGKVVRALRYAPVKAPALLRVIGLPGASTLDSRLRGNDGCSRGNDGCSRENDGCSKASVHGNDGCARVSLRGNDGQGARRPATRRRVLFGKKVK